MTTTSSDSQHDALVVGAGPTGLTMACELARRGLKIRIIDKKSEPSKHSKALVVQAKSLELFQKMGVVDYFLQHGTKGFDVMFHANGVDKSLVEFRNIGMTTTPYPYPLFISQAETEHCLTQLLESFGILIERQQELESFDDSEQDVVATIHDLKTGEKSRSRYRYLIGCDGAHSTVRTQLHLPFEGAPYEQNFVLADAYVSIPWTKNRLSVYLGRTGVMAVFPLSTDGLLRFIATLPASNPKKQNSKLTLEEMQKTARYYAGRSLGLHDPVWLSRFHLHHRLAAHYSKGHCFLVGDAAHIHSPAGGQGMNTGIQDAYNLAWKLELICRGYANQSILKSYEAERRPVGQRLIKTTDRFFQIAASGYRPLTFFRNLLIPEMIRLLMKTRRGRRFALGFISQLKINYRDSPIVSENIEPAKSGWDGPAPGYQAPNTLVQKQDGSKQYLFDFLKDSRFHLLALRPRWHSQSSEPIKAALSKSLGQWQDVVSIHCFDQQECLKDYAVKKEALYLIRPDGYIAYRSNKISAVSLKKYLKLYQ